MFQQYTLTLINERTIVTGQITCMLDRDYMPDTLNKDPTRGDSVINLTVEEVLAGFSAQGPTEFDGYLDPNSATNPRRSEPEKSSNYTYSISP